MLPAINAYGLYSPFLGIDTNTFLGMEVALASIYGPNGFVSISPDGRLGLSYVSGSGTIARSRRKVYCLANYAGNNSTTVGDYGQTTKRSVSNTNFTLYCSGGIIGSGGTGGGAVIGGVAFGSNTFYLEQNGTYIRIHLTDPYDREVNIGTASGTHHIWMWRNDDTTATGCLDSGTTYSTTSTSNSGSGVVSHRSGQFVSTGNYGTHYTQLQVLFKRRLTADERTMFMRDPLQIFINRNRNIWIPKSAISIPTLSSPLLITPTYNSLTPRVTAS